MQKLCKLCTGTLLMVRVQAAITTNTTWQVRRERRTPVPPGFQVGAGAAHGHSGWLRPRAPPPSLPDSAAEPT